MLNIRDYPFVALTDDLFYPGMGCTFELSNIGENHEALLAALATRNPTIALFNRKTPSIQPGLTELHSVGVLAELRKIPGMDSLEAVITDRVLLRDISHHPHPVAQVQLLGRPVEVRHLLEDEGDTRLRDIASKIFRLGGSRGQSSAELLDHFGDEKLEVVYFLASALALSVEEGNAVLSATTLTEAQETLYTGAQRLLDRLQDGSLTSSPIRGLGWTGEEGTSQMAGGEGRESARLLHERFLSVNLDARVLARLLPELEKLSRFDPGVAEHQELISRLEGLLCFPWDTRRTELPDLDSVERALNEAVLGHDEAKARLLDLYAARSLNPDLALPLVCLSGPPGVGKRTLARALAAAVNRPVQTIPLGRKDSQAQQLKGRSRRLPGAAPGAIYEAVLRAGNREAMLLIEINQPLSLEAADILAAITDPNHSKFFGEDYLGLPIDTSLILPVVVVRSAAVLPQQLLENAVVLEMQSYSAAEKATLLRARLWPAALERCGLVHHEATLDEPTVLWLVAEHSQESGVRNLSKALDLLAARLARRKLQYGAAIGNVLCLATVRAWFGHGSPLRSREGRATAVISQLSLTPSGAESLDVSVLTSADQPGVVILGEASPTVKDAFEVARSLALEHPHHACGMIGRASGWQVRVPEGSLAEDEGSLGLCLALVLRSAQTGSKIARDMAVVGRLDPAGDVLPVGSLRERALAAERAGFKCLIHPRGETADIADLRAELGGRLKLVDVSSLDEAVGALMPRAENDLRPSPRERSKKTSRRMPHSKAVKQQ